MVHNHAGTPFRDERRRPQTAATGHKKDVLFHFFFLEPLLLLLLLLEGSDATARQAHETETHRGMREPLANCAL